MVEEHIPLADGIARSVLHTRDVPAYVEREEVVAVAREALVKACRSFDPSYGVPPRHWISVRVWGAVIDTLRGMGPRTRHEHRNGLEPTYRPEVISLDAPLGEVEGRVVEAVLPADVVDPVMIASRDEVRRLLRKLRRSQRRILFRSFFEGLTAKEIAELEGISESRVQVLRTEGIERLRRLLGLSDTEEEPMTTLSEIELDVLHGTALGESASETAGRMTRSSETIKDHRRRIIRKLRAKNMYHALTIGFQAGLIQPTGLGVRTTRRHSGAVRGV